jgi:hypothetical protein
MTTAPPTPPAPPAGGGLSTMHLNRKEMMAGGGALAVVLGYVAFRARAKAKTAAAAGTGASTASSSASAAQGASAASTASPVIAGLSGTPNTSATDIQNYLQNLANQVATAGATNTAAAPAPTFDPTNAHLTRNDSTGAVWQVQQSGLYHLTQAQLAAVGGQTALGQAAHYSDPTEAIPTTNYVPFSPAATT